MTVSRGASSARARRDQSGTKVNQTGAGGRAARTRRALPEYEGLDPPPRQARRLRVGMWERVFDVMRVDLPPPRRREVCRVIGRMPATDSMPRAFGRGLEPGAESRSGGSRGLEAALSGSGADVSKAFQGRAPTRRRRGLRGRLPREIPTRSWLVPGRERFSNFTSQRQRHQLTLRRVRQRLRGGIPTKSGGGLSSRGPRCCSTRSRQPRAVRQAGTGDQLLHPLAVATAAASRWSEDSESTRGAPGDECRGTRPNTRDAVRADALGRAGECRGLAHRSTMSRRRDARVRGALQP